MKCSSTGSSYRRTDVTPKSVEGYETVDRSIRFSSDPKRRISISPGYRWVVAVGPDRYRAVAGRGDIPASTAEWVQGRPVGTGAGRSLHCKCAGGNLPRAALRCEYAAPGGRPRRRL